MANDTATAERTRDLVFKEGSSHKFWRIERAGAANVVTFGKVGTAGQTQTKEFADEAAAQREFDKLVAEKLRKGYTDAGTSPSPSAAPAASVPPKSMKPATTPEPAAEPTPPQAPAPVPRPARSIDLSPLDWRRAAFRNLPPLERPPVQPFDREAALVRLAKLGTERYGWDIKWRDLHLPPAMSAEEAEFWATAMATERDRHLTPKALADKLAKKKPKGPVTFEAAWDLMTKKTRGVAKEIAVPLANLTTPAGLIAAILVAQGGAGSRTKSQYHDPDEDLHDVADGFVRLVLPFATAEERAAARAVVARHWDPTQVSTVYRRMPCAYPLAAALGMAPEVEALVVSWPAGHYATTPYAQHYDRPQDVLCGVGSAAVFLAEWKRLGLGMHDADDVRTFLACTEYAALDAVRDAVLAVGSKDSAKDLLKAFALVHAPEAAPLMLECKVASKAPAVAGEWFDQNLAHAVEGLIPVAAGRGKLADVAVDFLRGVKRQGHAGFIEQLLAEQGDPGIAAKIRAEVLEHVEKVYPPLDDATTPDWLTRALAQAGPVKRKTLPSWADPALLPPLLVDGRRLSDAQMGAVMAALTDAKVPERPALLAAVREHIDPSVRDAFAWKLFEAWHREGSEAKHKWAMGAIGQIGSDGCALRLTPFVRNWPGESQHQRAVFGLECLRMIGSDAALMQLNGVAQKLKFKGLQQKAHEFVEEIAAARGMSRAELEDRIVPDCGLDERGNREFSFGERRFTFVLGPELKPMIRGSDGKLRPDLPKPTARDDPGAAERAAAEWKLLKKQIREVAQVNAARLERAMITDRRWGVKDFEALLVRHPLLTHLVRKLLWVAYDKSGKPVTTFRVTEEQDYAGAGDDAVSLAGAETVGLLHPIMASPEELARWGETLSDYEIIAPFPQLGRPVYRLDPAEANQKTLRAFHGMKLDAPTLVFSLEGLGWMRGLAADAGGFSEHSKQFPAADVTAVVTYDGSVGMGWIDASEILTVTDCFLVAGLRKPTYYADDAKKGMKLSEVPPLVLSEVLADLHRLKAKAKP